MKRLFKQYNIQWLGTFINVLYLTMPLFGIVAYGMTAVTLYATFIVPFVRPYIPWLNIWWFILVIFIGAIFILLIFWKFIYKAYFRNPIKQDIEQIKKHLGIVNEN